jgi:hypothetical protein
MLAAQVNARKYSQGAPLRNQDKTACRSFLGRLRRPGRFLSLRLAVSRGRVERWKWVKFPVLATYMCARSARCFAGRYDVEPQNGLREGPHARAARDFLKISFRNVKLHSFLCVVCTRR